MAVGEGAWIVEEDKAVCLAARNSTEMGGTDYEELEAPIRSNFTERLLRLDATGKALKYKFKYFNSILCKKNIS